MSRIVVLTVTIRMIIDLSCGKYQTCSLLNIYFHLISSQPGHPRKERRGKHDYPSYNWIIWWRGLSLEVSWAKTLLYQDGYTDGALYIICSTVIRQIFKKKKIIHSRTIYIGNLLATLRGKVETCAKAAQRKGAQRQDECVANPMRRNPSDLDFKPAGRPHLGQGGFSIRHGVTIVLVAFVVLLETIRALRCG